MSMRRGAAAVLAASSILLFLAGCEAIFTYSPLTALQRPPSSLPPEARLTYAQDALASGDKTAMKAAYDAIKADTGTTAMYTTAQLGIELSGVPSLILKAASDPSSLTTNLNDINSFIAANGLDPTYLVDAASKLESVDPDVPLTATDYAMGALGLLLGAANTANGNWDITALTPTEAQPAVTFFDAAVAEASSLPSTDPLRGFIDGFDTYISGL